MYGLIVNHLWKKDGDRGEILFFSEGQTIHEWKKREPNYIIYVPDIVIIIIISFVRAHATEACTPTSWPSIIYYYVVLDVDPLYIFSTPARISPIHIYFRPGAAGSPADGDEARLRMTR